MLVLIILTFIVSLCNRFRSWWSSSTPTLTPAHFWIGESMLINREQLPIPAVWHVGTCSIPRSERIEQFILHGNGHDSFWEGNLHAIRDVWSWFRACHHPRTENSSSVVVYSNSTKDEFQRWANQVALVRIQTWLTPSQWKQFTLENDNDADVDLIFAQVGEALVLLGTQAQFATLSTTQPGGIRSQRVIGLVHSHRTQPQAERLHKKWERDNQVRLMISSTVNWNQLCECDLVFLLTESSLPPNEQDQLESNQVMARILLQFETQKSDSTPLAIIPFDATTSLVESIVLPLNQI